MIELNTKQCTNCKEWKIASKEFFYKQKKKTKKKGEYYEWDSWCKVCKLDYQKQYQRDNWNDQLKRCKKHYNESPTYKINKVKLAKERVKNGKYIEWQRSENGKISSKKSQEKRRNKIHNITDKEWYDCRMYFNFRCAYCDLTYEEHFKTYKQDLHREHVIHDGRNDLKNCVPSCRVCNSEKHEATINQWYNPNNPKFVRERYLKIYHWLRFDVKDYIVKKKIKSQ